MLKALAGCTLTADGFGGGPYPALCTGRRLSVGNALVETLGAKPSAERCAPLWAAAAPAASLAGL